MASLVETIARARQAILLGIGFVILVMIGASSVWLNQQSNRSGELLTEALETQNAISLFSLSLRRAESSQRAYLITGQKNYLDGFNDDVAVTRRRFEALRKAVTDNERQRGALATVEDQYERKLVEMQSTIDRFDAGDRDNALAIVRQGTGARYMDNIRDATTQMAAEERRLVIEHQAAAEHGDSLLLGLNIAGAVLVAIIGALSTILMQRSSRQRAQALAALKATNDNLERIVEYRTADLQEASDEIQRFAYIVSHDLRSPLVNIMGFTSELEALRKSLFERLETLRRQPEAGVQTDGDDKAVETLGKDFDEAIDFIKTSIGKMDRLINAVLKLSREGRREFHPERIDMTTLAQSIAQTVAHRAVELGAAVTIGDLPDVESDRLALEQVFSNLIDNALKYLRDGVPGRIEITGRMNAVQAIYDVRDNGRGIDPRDHQRVFELFRRAGSQDRPGEGIGLAHVRALVRRLGGSIGLQSQPNEGSVFTVTLPRRWSTQHRSVA